MFVEDVEFVHEDPLLWERGRPACLWEKAGGTPRSQEPYHTGTAPSQPLPA
jgi:hypothetical protein